jgi:hypothetical protein
MWWEAQKSEQLFYRPESGAHVGLLKVEDQGSYYKAINALNYLPHQ